MRNFTEDEEGSIVKVSGAHSVSRYDSIIFDVDGTLWDASRACAFAWTQAAREFGLHDRAVTPSDIRRVSGLPFSDCVEQIFGDLPSSDVEALGGLIDSSERRAVESEGGDLFSGVVEGVAALSEEFHLSVVSNCQAWYLQAFLNRSRLRRYFQGADCYGNSQVPKAQMISSMVERFSLSSPVYVGDTSGDHQASSDAGVAFGYVSYGFGQTNHPDHEFSSFNDLVLSIQSLSMGGVDAQQIVSSDV